MNSMNMLLRRTLPSFLLAALLGACASAPPEHFYTLETDSPASVQAKTSARFSMTIQRVTVPESVDRPQLVLQVGGNQVRLDEQHRWAESLRQAIPHVVASDLRHHFPNAKIAVAADSSSEPMPAYFLTMDVLRFDSNPGDGVRLEVHWQLRKPTTASATASPSTQRDSISEIREAAGGPGYEALVAAHRRALARLANDIANSVTVATSRP